jgi:hypothetical protein
LKTMFLLLLRPSEIFIFFILLGALSHDSAASRLHSGAPHQHIYHRLDCRLADYIHLAAHSPQRCRWRVRKKQTKKDWYI